MVADSDDDTSASKISEPVCKYHITSSSPPDAEKDSSEAMAPRQRKTTAAAAAAPEPAAGGALKSAAADASSGDGSVAVLAAIVFVWYASSVVCTNTSKELGMHWSLLTMAQLMISTVASCVVILLFRAVPYHGVSVKPGQLQLTVALSCSFVLGFITLNMALKELGVSLAMTLRATEPLFTMVLASIFLDSEVATFRVVLGLLPVVLGASLSAAGSPKFTLMGLAAVVMCNMCFAARGVLTKKLKECCKVDNYSLFLHINAIGVAIQGVILTAVVQTGHVDLSIGLFTSANISPVLLVVNGLTFWAYLQLSWLVLSRVATVTHSVFNSLRRPVMCVFGWLQFGEEISNINAFGIALASAGSLIYAQVKRMEAKRLASSS